jgi:hypothetical protein
MAGIAREQGLGVIAPVRPSWKERYPLSPIERYAGWLARTRLLFDPWMCVHERLGAEGMPAVDGLTRSRHTSPLTPR